MHPATGILLTVSALIHVQALPASLTVAGQQEGGLIGSLEDKTMANEDPPAEHEPFQRRQLAATEVPDAFERTYHAAKCFREQETAAVPSSAAFCGRQLIASTLQPMAEWYAHRTGANTPAMADATATTVRAAVLRYCGEDGRTTKSCFLSSFDVGLNFDEIQLQTDLLVEAMNYWKLQEYQVNEAAVVEKTLLELCQAYDKLSHAAFQSSNKFRHTNETCSCSELQMSPKPENNSGYFAMACLAIGEATRPVAREICAALNVDKLFGYELQPLDVNEMMPLTDAAIAAKKECSKQ